MPLNCLIAAHDPWFIQLLRIFSEESGFRVVEVYEGQDVLPMINQEKPVAIFLQVDLPGKIKGWEVLHSIKADPVACQIPVLVFSWLSHLTSDESASMLLENAVAHLQEPVTFEIFQDALRKAGVGIPLPANKLDSPSGTDSSGKPKLSNEKHL